jgi:N-acetyl-anhydromuramyl-L-alanine amidase AmpD
MNLPFNYIKNLFGLHQSEDSGPILEFHPILPTKFEFRQSPNFRRPLKPRSIKYIIIHATESSFDLALHMFEDPKTEKSSHYLLDKFGNLVQLVEETDIAWHAGVSKWNGDNEINSKSIGIELANLNNGIDPYPLIQSRVLMYLVLTLCQKYRVSIDHILRHSDISGPKIRPKEPKVDPKGFPWEKFKREISILLSQIYPS